MLVVWASEREAHTLWDGGRVINTAVKTCISPGGPQ